MSRAIRRAATPPAPAAERSGASLATTAALPAPTRTLPVDGSPVKGSPDARVTILEFSEFQ